MLILFSVEQADVNRQIKIIEIFCIMASPFIMETDEKDAHVQDTKEKAVTLVHRN